MSTSQPLVPEFLRGLVDDAAVFPPGDAPLDEALRSHAAHRAAPYADLVGPFVVGDGHLPALDTDEPLGISVVVSGGAGALEPAVAWATRNDLLTLRGLEIAMRQSDAGDLAPNARRIVTAVDGLVAAGALPDDVPVYVEPPRLYDGTPTASWLAALDEIAASDHRLKLRTGGLDVDAFPGSAELATCIGAALDRELRFKCTAGLHRAVRHRDPETGLEHHGFLNVLLATRASLDGADLEDVVGVLEQTDAAVLVGATRPDALAGAHRWFTSFGSCSVLDPVSDLEALDLLETR